MSKEYICNLCNKVFNQKNDYTRHINKKTPCISMNEIQKINKVNDIKKDLKTVLINLFKGCLDILRDNEGLTGEKALRNMTYLFILKLIEPYFGNEIDIDNDKYYDFSDYENAETHKNTLYKLVRFSNLIKEEELNIPNLMKYLWEDILSKHPSTKDIFLTGKRFDIQHTTTFKLLLEKINTIELTKIDNDVLGDAYEEVVKDTMTGKVLGQFFTQPLIKKMMVKLIDPQIHPDGTIETCGDPTMGTAGFLITYLKYILEQAKLKNIKPDWEFIKTEGLYGRELEPDTYQLAVSNMIISSGHTFEKLERGDSIRTPITRKFDNVLANPPFGIKGLKYSDYNFVSKNEYVPIRTDNAVSLFIQVIIYMLKINGKCAVVLPDGQDLFTKSNTTLIAIREYLLKTCDLKEIIYLPSGIFTNTSIKTCVFYFVKKREGTDVLNVDIKYSKLEKETSRDYKFTKTHQTHTIKFYDYNPYEEVKNLLVEVPIEKVANNYYSLNYAEYMKEENNEEEKYSDDIVVKTLGEVCNFEIGGTPSRSKNEYYENGNNLWVSVRELNGGYIYDTNEKITDLGVQNSSVKLFVKDTILFSFKLSIGKTGIAGKPLYTNEAIAGILSKNNALLDNKYLYYYLSINDFSKLGSGILGNGSLNKKSLAQLKIPFPPLERQKQIVEYLDFIYEKTNKTSEEKIRELKKLNEYSLNMQKIFGTNDIKTLGEVCEINQGTSLIKTEMIDGIYDVIGGGKIIGKHNIKNREGNDFTLTRVGDININYIDKPYYLTDNGFSLKSILEDVMTKYIYYLLSYNKDYLYTLYKGSAQKVISKTSLKSLKIQIPSLERQQEIVEYCEKNDAIIKQLEQEIESNKKLAEQFMLSVLQNTAVSNDDDTELMDKVDDDENQDNTQQPEKKVSNETSSSCKITVAQLRDQCKSLGIKGYSNKNKETLLKMIEQSKTN
jgi:type I restriction-modification system DNA methylase subunit/restriction endonuclease S subunit